MNNRFQWNHPSEGLKFPRTLEQAFGPDTSRVIEEQYDPMPVEDKIVIAACCAAVGVVGLMAIVGWIK